MCASVFFCDRLAADNSSGAEVIAGTPLRMPASADYKSFRKIIAQVIAFQPKHIIDQK
jgi:hypothetical protein